MRPRRRWGAWLLAVARSRDLGLRPQRRAPQPVTPERIGLMTLATTAIAFGVHSTVDWTWFVPGTAVTGLLCAGWVAGRGPFDRAAAAGPASRAARAPGAPLAGGSRSPRPSLVVGLAGAWTIWQPQRAADANDAALAALDAGHLPQARRDARARGSDQSALARPALHARRGAAPAQASRTAARATLQQGVRLQPANPETWLRLGQLELNRETRGAAV